MGDLKTQIAEATKVAMKARAKQRVAALRLVNSEIQRLEIDERKALSDDDVIGVLNRMLKQRNDSLSQFKDAGRTDLADQEQFEIDLIRTFMPEPLSEAELDALVESTIAAVGASSMQDMGKVMGQLKAETQGRADMGSLSAKVKAKLA
ncbi:MAG: GatB/YqeY domain-containing protein [Gammaproteobacteria bacterium]|nr:GatB/YqeY domain-containing protein [Gammaproteobacteria bacterium]